MITQIRANKRRDGHFYGQTFLVRISVRWVSWIFSPKRILFEGSFGRELSNFQMSKSKPDDDIQDVPSDYEEDFEADNDQKGR